MQQEHRELRRDVPDSEHAVLFIHGICSSPVFFTDFYAHVPEDWSIRSVLIEGHGATTKDFSHSSMNEWRQQIDDVVDEMAKQHRSILIVGHSMGTLFAIEQSVRRPDKIKALFLLAVPLKARPHVKAACQSIRTALDLPSGDDPAVEAAKRLYSIEPDRKVWHYFGFIPRYYELLHVMQETRARVPDVEVPCFVFQSRHDEIVSEKSYDMLAENPKIQLHWLEHSDHKYHPPKDKAFLLQRFDALCQVIA